jgi:hypothetical protein
MNVCDDVQLPILTADKLFPFHCHACTSWPTDVCTCGLAKAWLATSAAHCAPKAAQLTRSTSA